MAGGYRVRGVVPAAGRQVGARGGRGEARGGGPRLLLVVLGRRGLVLRAGRAAGVLCDEHLLVHQLHQLRGHLRHLGEGLAECHLQSVSRRAPHEHQQVSQVARSRAEEPVCLRETAKALGSSTPHAPV